MKKKLLTILICSANLLPAEVLADDEVRFGRLFTEPKTRQQLDESRKHNSSKDIPVAEEEEENALTSLKMDGVIVRRDGSTEVWINGTRSESPQLDVRRSGGNQFQVAVPGGGEVTLKPGQIYLFESRRVLEGYEAAKEQATDEKKIAEVIEQFSATAEMAGSTSASETKKTDKAGAAGASQFNESELVEQDFPIKLEKGKSGQ